MDWRHRAICRDEDPELFFPVGTSGPALLQIAEAKTVCRRCPVVSECLTWALESGQDAGVWGGMSEDERRARAARRLSARRSSSLMPPQTPASWPDSRAHWRQVSTTGQRRQTLLASSIWRRAGPVFPTGKNSSGSLSRHAARLRQSMLISCSNSGKKPFVK